MFFFFFFFNNTTQDVETGMLKIGRDHLIRVVILFNWVESCKRVLFKKKKKKRTKEKKKKIPCLVQICCIVEMITKSFDSWGRDKNKHELLLEIHGPCFHAFLVLINPSWCLWGLKINYSFWEKKNWQTTLRTPERILDFQFSFSPRCSRWQRSLLKEGIAEM